MAKLTEMKKAILSEYVEKYDELEKIAFKLHELEEREVEIQVIKKMAGLKLMIDYYKDDISFNPEQ